ncbi:MAG: adenylosuccinate synthetase [Candidatus Thiodiazotropha endolucinida]
MDITKIVVLSGQVSVGKSTLAHKLVSRFSALHCSTGDIITTLKPDVPRERKAMQEAGEALDRAKKGEWVAQGLRQLLEQNDHNGLVVVDSIRVKEQIHALRKYYGTKVVHIHLSADETVLSSRYKKRKQKIAELKSFSAVLKNETERNIYKLETIADAVVKTDRSCEEDVFVRTAAHLGLYPLTARALVDVMVGGQYGSEGKGNIANYIAPEYDVLVRTGGPNAGHKVFHKPTPLTFRHIPSGASNAPNAKLILGPGAVIDVKILLEEIADNGITVDHLFIDPQATIIDAKDIGKEQKLERIASTQKGVGAAIARRILERGGNVQLAKDISELKPFITKSCDVLEDAYFNSQRVLIEGTQGTGLSLFHGKYPSVTSRDTTVSAFLAEAGVSPKRVRKVILVVRTYPIRVGGNSGPMSKKLSYAELHRRSKIPLYDLKETEKATVSKTQRRLGEFDWVQLRESSILNSPTDIALTFADYLGIENRDARRFEQLTPDTINFIVEIERVSGAPVSLISTRFHYRNIIDRRAW